MVTKSILLASVLLIAGLLSSPEMLLASDQAPHPEFGMTLYYKLDGNPLDASGFGRNGTLSGPVGATDKWGNTSGAMAFNGSTNYMSIPESASAGLSKFTISLWIKTTESRTGTDYWTHPTIAGFASGAGDFALCLNNGRPGFFGGLAAGGDNSYYSATALNDNVWHHLAAINDGTRVRLYIDGILDTGGQIFSGLPLTNAGFYLGKSNLADPLGFAGLIDEFRIYNRALTATEVSSLATVAPISTVPLTITRTGNGTGTVSISPQGVTCTEPYCSLVLPPGSSVTLKASPDISSIFSGWSDNCTGSGDCSLTLNSPKSVTDAFTLLVSDLLARYPFSGNADDASGNGNNGTVNGATLAQDRFGIALSAYAFNGIDQNINLNGTNQISSSRTFSIWVLPKSNSGYGMPILTAGNTDAADFIGVGATGGACGYGANRLYIHHSGSACMDSSVDLTVGSWNHIVISYDADANTITFYRNGVKVKSVTGSLHDYEISTVVAGGNSIGGLTTKASFNGSLDDLAIFSRALNNAEALSLYYRHGLISTISTPADGSSLTASVVDISGTAVAVSGHQANLVEVSLDNGLTWQMATDTSGNSSWSSWNYSWYPSATSSYIIRSRVRDLSGYYEIGGSSITVNVISIYTPTAKTAFSTAGDFNAGLLDGVSMVGAGLQLTGKQQPLPFLWVPNNNDTVSKVDTASGRELGRYRSVPTGVYGNNSRTTVDLEGNVWLGNRNAGSLLKIGLLENGQCVDRNGNGAIDTSRDINGDGVISDNELLPWGEDECVLVEVILIPGKEGSYIPGTYAGSYENNFYYPGPRSIAVDRNNNVWVGTYGTQKFYFLNGTDGRILKSVDVSGHTPYGAVMDYDGIVWSSGDGDNILHLDTNSEPPTVNIFNPGVDVYGIAIDYQGYILTAGNDDSRLTRINRTTRDIEWSVVMPNGGRGLAADRSGNIWVASSYANQVFRYSSTGTLLARISVPTDPIGVAIDHLDQVWAIGSAESIYRINPVSNHVDLESTLTGSSGHYAYSDMTGAISRAITTHTGAWSIIHDSGTANKPWGTITWSADVPAMTSLRIKVRSSSDLVNWSAWETATSGTILKATPDGRYLMVMAVFSGGPSGATPALHSLTIAAAPTPLNQRDKTAPSGTLKINGGAAVANTTAVMLSLAATDDSGIVAGMRFSSDGSAWGGWVSYEPMHGWTLSAGDGSKNVYVQFRDAAGNLSPTVHATITLHVTHLLSVTINSIDNGGGSVHSVPPGIACSTGTCSASFSNNELVTLHATPDASSIFDGWSDACSGTSDCSLTIDGDKIAGASFIFIPPVRIAGATPTTYSTLQSAYDNAVNRDVIEMRGGTLTDSILAEKPIIVIVRGGFNASYSSRAGRTHIEGAMILRSGTLKADGICLK